MQEFINMLSPNLEFISMYSNDDCIIFQVQSKIKDPICPYCGKPAQKCHSKYKKSFNDLPMHGKNVVIEIINRKIFCNNPNCSHKTFAETYDFIERSQKKTKRLIQHIIDTSKNMSSILAQNTLRKSGVNVGKSTICSFLKK